jgi:predicted nucleic acid-binding protein
MTLYLDTSVVSALFDSRNPERQEITRDFFDLRSGDRMLVSELTLAEIEATADLQHKQEMARTIAPFEAVSVTDEVEELAQQYVAAGAVPQRHLADAYHIALGVIYRVDMVVSWNFRHMVRHKTRDTVNMVNTTTGRAHLEIVSPGELL